MPEIMSIGPLQLDTVPIKSSLKAFSSNWKTQFASHLHQQAKEALDKVTSEREAMMKTLTLVVTVGDLETLRQVLDILEHIDNLQHSIDGQYLPVENMYRQLRYR